MTVHFPYYFLILKEQLYAPIWIRNFMLILFPQHSLKQTRQFKTLLPVLSTQWGFNQIPGIWWALRKTIRVFLSSILLNTSQTFPGPGSFSCPVSLLLPNSLGKNTLCTYILSICPLSFLPHLLELPGKAEVGWAQGNSYVHHFSLPIIGAGHI